MKLPGNASMMYEKIIPVVAVRLIDSHDFDSLVAFGECVDNQNLPIVAVTPEAMKKYEQLVTEVN